MNDKKNTLAYKMGSILAIVISICTTVVIVGITIKFLLWLF